MGSPNEIVSILGTPPVQTLTSKFSQQTMARTSQPQRPYVVLFGDSLTQMGYGEFTLTPTSNKFEPGWVSLLSTVYQRRADIFNRGYSGYNTRHTLDIMLPRVLAGGDDLGTDDRGAGDNNDTKNPKDPSSKSVSPRKSNGKPLFCTVFLGANDQALPGERQHVPKDEYSKNLATIIRRIREHYNNNGGGGGYAGSSIGEEDDNFPIIVFSPPPVDQVTWRRELGLYEHFDRTNDVARQYGLAAKDVASSLGCPFFDVWELLGGHDLQIYGQHLCDGLHLSASGNRLLFDGLLDLIHTQLPHLSPSNTDDSIQRGIQVDGPLWSDLC